MPKIRPTPKPYKPNYPATVEDVLDGTMTFKPSVIRAMREFKRSKPWRGTKAERVAKFERLHAALCVAYGLTGERAVGLVTRTPRVACYIPALREIHMSRMSVVTYLHEFGHARGYDERDACAWSINLFRRVFPRTFERCRREAHMLIRPEAPRNDR